MSIRAGSSCGKLPSCAKSVFRFFCDRFALCMAHGYVLLTPPILSFDLSVSLCRDGPSSPVLGKRPRLPGACTVETVDAKVTAGRYRSTGAFESDIRQLLTHGKGPRSISTEQVSACRREMGLFDRDGSLRVAKARAIILQGARRSDLSSP